MADFNSATNTLEQLPLTGTYTLDITGVGTLTITTPQGTQTFALYVHAAEAAASVRSAQLVETDGGSVASSGTLGHAGARQLHPGSDFRLICVRTHGLNVRNKRNAMTALCG